MEMQIRLPNGNVIKIEGDTDSELFENWARCVEVFGEARCTECGCEVLTPVVRQNKDEDKFYELHCTEPKCRARLAYGNNKKGGGLFPKRKLIANGQEKGKPDSEKGEHGTHQGWTKFKGVAKKGE